MEGTGSLKSPVLQRKFTTIFQLLSSSFCPENQPQPRSIFYTRARTHNHTATVQRCCVIGLDMVPLVRAVENQREL